MRQIYLRFTAVLLLATACLLGGCHTETDPSQSGHMASLQISGSSEADILRTMKDIFANHGYQHVEDLNFDKRGSAWQTALYGGWAEDGVWIRMKASIDAEPSGSYLIGCDAFRVTDHSQGVMEEEKPAYAYHKECQSILGEIQARLVTRAAGASQP
jgi:hypothetical protein